MAREVIKRVGARAYRYRVESYRDGAKVRARWTYLGVADASDGAAKNVGRAPQRAAVQTRELLVDAFERLTEAGPYVTMTAGAVSTEAGLAHGTFYRYFKNKREILMAALERIREAFDRVRPSFNPPFGHLADERARVRAWTRALGMMPASRGVLHAWFDALESDPELRATRDARVCERTAGLTTYLEALAKAGTIVLPRPAALASALTTLIDASFRSAIVSGVALDETTLSGLSDVFDRAIFQADREA